MPILSAINCSKDAYISCAIMIAGMIAIIFILQLLIYGELYQNSRACFPILYFFGEKYGFQQTIARIAKDTTLYGEMKNKIKKVTFAESFETGDIIHSNNFTIYFEKLRAFTEWLYYVFSDFNTGMTKTIQHIKTFEKTYYDEVIKPRIS
jgi:hypothetical protein